MLAASAALSFDASPVGFNAHSMPLGIWMLLASECISHVLPIHSSKVDA